MSQSIVTQEIVRELLDYNPETGVFRWRERARHWFKSEGAWKTFHTRRAGTVAGSVGVDGYIRIKVQQNLCAAHRLAWLWVHGRWPADQIDHIDEDKANNRLSNLRDVDKETNCQNISRARRHNRSTGLLGAHLDKGGTRYVAHIVVSGKQRHLGQFATAEEAHQAYMTAKADLHAGWVTPET